MKIDENIHRQNWSNRSLDDLQKRKKTKKTM